MNVFKRQRGLWGNRYLKALKCLEKEARVSPPPSLSLSRSSTLNHRHKLENLRVKKVFPLVWRPNISGDGRENWKEKLNKGNFYFNNIDINLICEKPKVSNHRNKILKSLAKLLDVDESLINLKGKTVEKLGLIGKEKAIACEVIVSISKYDC